MVQRITVGQPRRRRAFVEQEQQLVTEVLRLYRDGCSAVSIGMKLRELRALRARMLRGRPSLPSTVH
ncbi:MAG: hypothetical protein ACYDBB_05505 [Armatimonadota bacterium]